MRTVRLIAAAVAAIALWNAGEARAQNRAQDRPWGEDYIPNLTVMTQEGKPLRFYDDLVKGKIVIISFIYTSCTDICPLTTARMTLLEQELGDLVGRDVFMLSMTVDPENDTPERLKAYSAQFNTGRGWSFVTGKPEDIRAINYKFGERSTVLSEHRNEIVLGNDVTGQWQKDSVFGDIRRLALAVRSLDPKWQDQVRTPSRDASSDRGLAMSSEPGQALFKKVCAPPAIRSASVTVSAPTCAESPAGAMLPGSRRSSRIRQSCAPRATPPRWRWQRNTRRCGCPRSASARMTRPT